MEPDKQMCPSATIVLNSQFKTGRKNLIVFTLFLEISGKMKPKRPKYAIQHLANFKARLLASQMLTSSGWNFHFARFFWRMPSS